LIIRVDATHADLLAAAGPGRYRLEAVDDHGRKVDGVPVACTGPLSGELDDEVTGDDEEEGEPMFHGSAARRAQMEDVLCQMLANQTRMVEATLGQMGTVIAGVAGLLHAVHQTGVAAQVPPQFAVPPAPPSLPSMPQPVEPEPDETEDAPPDEGAAPPSALPEALRLIIEKTIDKLVPLIFEKVTSGGGLGGLPLAAFLDWRKAMPQNAPAATTAATAPAEPAAATATTAPAAPAVTTAPAAYAAPAAPTSAHATHSVTAQPAATASAGAAPSPTTPHGAAPAATAPKPASALNPQELTQEEAAAMLNAHILQIWQGLTSAERSRATELISGLTNTQRSAWFAELARLTVPEAIARARAVLRAQPPPASPTNPLLTATPKGDPS